MICRKPNLALWPISGLHHQPHAPYRARPPMSLKVIFWLRTDVRLALPTPLTSGGQAPEKPLLETNLILTASPLMTPTRCKSSSLALILKILNSKFLYAFFQLSCCCSIYCYFSAEKLNYLGCCYIVLCFRSNLGF